MLYVSTRNPADSFTAYRALHEDRTPDGGLFAPHRLNVLSQNELRELSGMTFGERVARILNIFFPVALTGWDVDFVIGRHSVKMTTMNHRIHVAELWHNLKSDFLHTERALFSKLCAQNQVATATTAWARVAIRIAILAGIIWETDTDLDSGIDFAYFTGDYCFILAAWYARMMGLPIGRIICTSDEQDYAWDLLHKGEYSPVRSGCASEYPDLVYLELLIFAMYGTDEVQRYTKACINGTVYRLNDEQLAYLNSNLDSAVVSRTKVIGLIRSIFRTHDYISDPCMAIAYVGLQNYRSRTGFSRATLLLSEISPKAFEKIIYEATGISAAELRKYIGNS